MPEWLNNSRVGRAGLEAVCLNSFRSAPSPSEEPTSASTKAETVEETDACTCEGMPGLGWTCEIGEERYAKVDNRRVEADVDDDDEVCVLDIVNAYAGGMGADPSYDLSGELPPDFHPWSLRDLTLLTEVARRKLDTERWDTNGSWRLRWLMCDNDVTNPLDEVEDIDPSGDDLDGESGEIRYHISVENDGDAHTVQVVGTRGGEQHVLYHEPVPEPGGGARDTGTLEGLRSLLERVAEQVYRDAGYKVEGEWMVDWLRCHVLLLAD
ncbi:hypothetical protein GCM10027073_08960 [Streptomyces chlorus]|uniref:Uncharacterized protein n=1 Tax=Streptomyces chlorus TaxID=887452 RepID=A0ABW1DW93_9ACTN